MKRQHFWAAVLVAVLLGLAAGAGRTTVEAQAIEVVAEGVGAVTGGGVARARDEALRDAYRVAVEQGAGVSVASRTDMSDFTVFYDRVVSQAGGYVQSYQIVGDYWQTPDGLVHVKIRARVVRGDIRSDVQALGILIDMMGNPTIMVLVDEKNLNSPLATSIAETKLIERLSAVRYHLVDRRQVEAIKASDMAKRAMQGDIEAAVTLGERFAADIVVFGDVNSKFLTSTRSGNFTFQSCMAFGTFRAVLTQTGQIIWAETPQATKAQLSADAAGLEAIAAVANDVASRLIWELPKRAGGGVSGGTRTIQLTVSGCSYTQANQIIQALKETRDTTAVYRRTFENNIAVIDIQTTGNVDDLAAALESFASPKVEIVMVTRDKIEVRVIR
ncbi:MAG: hypothetical protein NUW12_00055 [Firmicutes bacterium]|jgi:hypothetical protein|nr:hypothetical protein [Bacillota bacterium]MDH7494342.1 hypothetical protein [Bacillota bacterium]